MSFLSGLFALAFSSLLVQAAPTPEGIALARKYAPQWRFHKDEIYWPSTVEYFLAGVKLVDSNGAVVNGALNNQNLDDATNQGDGLFLSTDIKASKGGFLRGQNPSATATSVYTFIVPKTNGIVDLYYWLFTPFNQAKSVPLLGQIGDHVGDWERMTVRTVNGVATQVDYHAHSDTGSGTIPWAQVAKFDNDQRPVGWVAQGSHGFWSSAGTFTYVNAVIFKLQDKTTNDGVFWDTKDSLTTIGYPESYTGALEWLNYKGKWGNKGTTNCWWHAIYSECEIVDGPGGPARDDVLSAAKTSSKAKTNGPTLSEVLKAKMRGPLSQTLATVSTEGVSSYLLRIDAGVHTVASDASYTFLAVEQRCISTTETETEDEEPNSTITTTTAAIPLTDASEFTITPEACAEGASVASYTIGLCSSDDATDCTWSAQARTLRAFSSDPAVFGIQTATAVTVDDLDTWEWES